MEYINNKSAGILVFFLLVGVHLLWCLYVAYPLILDKYIRQGLSWIYVPLRWKGAFKSFVWLLTQVFFSLEVIAGGVVLWFFFKTISSYVLMGIGVILIVVLFLIQSLVLKIRYKQQENVYFAIRGKISRDMRQKAIDKSESEIDNLASFQFQNMLREADNDRHLIKKLNEQNKQAIGYRKNTPAMEELNV